MNSRKTTRIKPDRKVKKKTKFIPLKQNKKKNCRASAHKFKMMRNKAIVFILEFTAKT